MGIATTALQVAIRKAEEPDSKAYWSHPNRVVVRKPGAIQIKINKSADTQALPDLSITDATIAMVQAK